MEIVPYQPEHLGELLSFLRRQFPDCAQKGDPSFFQWRFARNPLGSSLDNCHLAMENNRIVGQLGAIRDRMWANGRWRDCCWLVDLMLAPEHREAQSMAALGLFQQAMKKCPLLLVTGAGPKLAGFYKSLRWNYRDVFGDYFAIRRPGPLQAVTETRPIPNLRPAQEFEYSSLDRYGAETGNLIGRVLPSLAVTSHRSPAYLNWKFNQRPRGMHFTVTARRKGQSHIDGYMTVKIMERRPHARWAEIADFLVEPGTPMVFEALLDQATLQALDLDVDFLRLRCSLGEHRDRLNAPFWIHRSRPVIDGVFFHTDDAELGRYLVEAPWHLTSLVSDRTDHGADEFSAESPAARVERAMARPA